ncbi:MAG: GDP-mannose 4,6-dehydratase [Candidatus Aenigmarchaeota archaeon]|nr:GDP-mannose 4,6-dehydratase [Candidatus Aenigmarchaeota archaeon]
MSVDFDDMDVLVTGGNGFIGSHLVTALAERGANVHVFSLNNNNIRDIPRVKFFRIDVRDFDAVRNAVKSISPKKVFHLAAIVNVSRDMKDAWPIADVKINGTLNMIRALEGTDYDCFINTGTCEEYGQNKPPFTEDMMPMPVSPYSASNASATIMCKMLHDVNGLPLTTLRQFTCYGPGQKPGMLIPYVITSAIENKDIRLTGGEQKRDFNYVDDAVDSFLKAAVEKRAAGEIINIGTGKSHKIMDVVTSIIKISGSSSKPLFGTVPYREQEIWDIRADISKAESILGWKPATSLAEGLERTIEWYGNFIEHNLK